MIDPRARLQQCLQSYFSDRGSGAVLTGMEVQDLHPDLVIELTDETRIPIEILTPGHSPSATTRKIGSYFEAGAGEVWLIDPEDQMVELWNTPRFPLQLTDDDVISSVALPGFALPVSELFAK